jgi:alpha-beta hydrolase superfamily lysophospholipase
MLLFAATALTLALTPQVGPFAVPSADGYVLTGQADAPQGVSRGVVILVAGTGAFDRDVSFGRSETPRDRLFADLAERFNARGLTAVRFDRRGVRHGVSPAETIDAAAAPSVTAENLSADVGAIHDWTRSDAGLGARCVVFFAHSEGAVHVAGLAKAGAPEPALVIGMGAPLESKVSAVRWQVSGRDADSLVMMDADGDGTVTNEEVRANWMNTPSAVFEILAPFLHPNGAWTPADLDQLRATQGALYEQAKTAAMGLNDTDPYPNAAAPVFSGSWWKSWMTDDEPLAVRFAHWQSPMILHYGERDSQVRENRQRAAAEGVLPPGQVRFVSHPGRGHSLGTETLMGPVDEAIADRIADEAAAACPGSD